MEREQRQKAIETHNSEVFERGQQIIQTHVMCPVCGRTVAFNGLATNLKGERIMVWHYRENWQRCDGSSVSIRVAKKKLQSGPEAA